LPTDAPIKLENFHCTDREDFRSLANILIHMGRSIYLYELELGDPIEVAAKYLLHCAPNILAKMMSERNISKNQQEGKDLIDMLATGKDLNALV
jgi:hypothetical protein